MTWTLASDLTVTLRDQGKTDEEIIRRLEITTDRYKNYYQVGMNNNKNLKQQILDLRIKHKELIHVEVDSLWISEWGHTYAYWRHNRYVYAEGFFKKDTGNDFDPYHMDEMEWKFKILIEPISYHRPLETTGEVVGTLQGKKLVEIVNVHGFNNGDRVYVRQEKDYE